MADKTFRLEIVTPDRLVLGETVTSLVAPGVEGYIGILANHAPLLIELKPGEIDIRRPDESETVIAVGGGFMEVSGNHVIVLADTAELAEEIDVARAEEAIKRAQELLRKRSDPDVDSDRAEMALMRALNRLRVAGRAGH